MAFKQTAALLVAVIFSTVIEDGYGYTYSRVVSPGVEGQCYDVRCGINAKCTLSEGRHVCSCLNLHMGDPSVRCERVECLVNEDCPSNRACLNNACVDACPCNCGLNAQCQTVNHEPICTCAPRYTGDPYTNCVLADPCENAGCGLNTECKVLNLVPVCSCLPGYVGSPLSTGCRHECESDSECPQHQSCSSSFKCESPCKCGNNANCEVKNHRATCTCPPNWQGDPYTSCRPECTYDSDCPRGKPVCSSSKCVNPCEGACGVNANCDLRGTTPVCSCPKDRTGNPFELCRHFEPRDLCEPNPCGTNAICTPGHDNTGKDRPVCTCPQGYIGNALTSCQRGECFTDDECPNNKACINYSCQNPCTGHECAHNAICEPKSHIAVCTCPEGTRGDAISNCIPVVGRSSNIKQCESNIIANFRIPYPCNQNTLVG